MFLARVVPLVCLFASGVWAQFEMAKCKLGYEWNQNSKGQDACAIGSALDASCRGLVVYNYPPLNSTQYYLPPRKDHPGDLTCDCNTVMYNFYMACASCQGGQIYSWTAWIAACESVYIAQYPIDIPQGTPVPHWAYFDSTTLDAKTLANKTYDEATMITIGRDPEESPKPVSTISSPSTVTSSSSTGTSSPRPDSTGGTSSNTTTKSGTNVGAIVGGVVGSVVPLTILAVVVFFYMRHRRQQQAQQQVQNVDGFDPYKQRLSTYGPPVTSVPFTPYNPADPSTFPPQSPQSSVTYTTPTRGVYNGAPEV